MSLPQLLAGCVVLVTGDRRAGDLRAALERRGARVVHTPALTIVPHTADAELVERTRALLAAPPDIVVVTTAIGFRGWVEAADAAGLGEELHDVLDATRIIARGPKARGRSRPPGTTPTGSPSRRPRSRSATSSSPKALPDNASRSSTMALGAKSSTSTSPP